MKCFLTLCFTFLHYRLDAVCYSLDLINDTFWSSQILCFEYEMEQDKTKYRLFIHVTKQLIDLMGAQPISHIFLYKFTDNPEEQ
jgi:hypothetical protein